MADTLLVVEDEGAIREAFCSAFSGEGYEVHAFASGEDALSFLDTKSVDVAFLDLMLPGMNGVELCKAIRANNPITACFAITGHRSLFELTTCREAGFEDYFTKPVRLGLLFKTAEQAFDRLHRWKYLRSGG